MTIFHLASVTEERSSAQTWFALGNATFCRLWFASVASGIFVSAQEVTTTWLMHDLGASSFQLSLTAAAASAPFFLFTLPAGAFADIVSRRGVIVGAVLWQGVCVALLALGAWLEKIGPAPVLACIFALGIGIAFAAPVWGAVVPDIVSKEELPSAVTLGGVQQNLAGIVGPALGGFLLPLLGAPILISINALTFLVVAVVVLFSRFRQPQLSRLRESFSESFTNSLRYALNSPRIKTILLRNALFSVAVSFIPALLPVIALKELNLSAGQLGLLFTCVGIGSLAGAMILLPYLRQRVSPNGITSIAMALLTAVLSAMVLVRQPPALMVCATVAGVAWALAGSELWLAGQRVMPAWVRGRMNALQIVVGQGGIALGAVLLGAGATHWGLNPTLAATAVLALAVLALGHRLSINFAVEASTDAAPVKPIHDFPVPPQPDDGPVTVTIEYSIAGEDREKFRALTDEIQAVCRRNGAFQCRIDESLEHPGLFRLDCTVSTWAEHLRQHMRMTIDESQVFKKASDLNSGGSKPAVRHFLSIQRAMDLHGFGFSGRTFANYRDRIW